MWVALKTKIVEKDVYFEITIESFPFVFPDIFRAELHLSSADIVPILDEGSIKHNPTDHLLTEPLMVKDNLGVTTHRK